jgi:hypothetical protein
MVIGRGRGGYRHGDCTCRRDRRAVTGPLQEALQVLEDMGEEFGIAAPCDDDDAKEVKQ